MDAARSKYDKAIEDYYSLRPFRYSTVTKMELSYAQTYIFVPPVLQLDIELCVDFDTQLPQLILHFTDVQLLRFNPLIAPTIQLMQLEIQSIHGRQWEDLHYSVHEVEHDVLKFLCKDFTAGVVSA